MVSVKEAPANLLVEKVAEKLKENENVRVPAWATFVKTGAHAERRPQRKDWWYVRCASLLRKLYVENKIGVGRLRVWYGGRKSRGAKPERHMRAGGKIIRTALQQLENAGYVKKEEKARILTPQGRKLLDKTALELRGEKLERKRAKSIEGAGAGRAEVKKEAGVIGGAAASAEGGTTEGAKGTGETGTASKTSGARGKGKTGKTKAGKPPVG